MESTIEDWSKETLAQAQKDLEEQKIQWEMQQQQKLAQDNCSKMDIDDESCPTEDLLTYSRLDNLNQVKKYSATTTNSSPTIMNGGYCSIATKS